MAKGMAKEGFGLRITHVQWIARILVMATLVVFGSVWTYRYYHSTSWGAAEKAAIWYGVAFRLLKLPMQSFSMQKHHRWHGVWLEPYFFVETLEYHSVKKPSYGRPTPYLEITVSGETGAVVATDVSPRLKARYPIQGFDNH